MVAEFEVVGEASTDELGRVALQVRAFPPGAIVQVSWVPGGAHATADYEGWGAHEASVLRAAMAEADRFMRANPDALSFYRG